MNVLRYVLLPIACGVAMTASAAPTSSLDGVSGKLLDASTQVGEASLKAVSLDTQSFASAIGSIATPAANAAVKTAAIASPKAVPEPGSLALLGIAGAALFVNRKRRAKA